MRRAGLMPYEFSSRPKLRWTEDDDLRLRTMVDRGEKIPAIATALGRTKSAVIARKGKLGLGPRSG
jgi:hypothetical protein